MSKEVKLEKFEGPLDLLLQLIEREEMSISEISLSQVTEQFFNGEGLIAYSQSYDPQTGRLVTFDQYTYSYSASEKRIPHKNPHECEVCPIGCPAKVV